MDKQVNSCEKLVTFANQGVQGNQGHTYVVTQTHGINVMVRPSQVH